MCGDATCVEFPEGFDAYKDMVLTVRTLWSYFFFHLQYAFFIYNVFFVAQDLAAQEALETRLMEAKNERRKEKTMPPS